MRTLSYFHDRRQLTKEIGLAYRKRVRRACRRLIKRSKFPLPKVGGLKLSIKKFLAGDLEICPSHVF